MVVNSASLLPFLLSNLWKWAGFCFIFEKYFWRNAFDTHIFSYNDLMIKYSLQSINTPLLTDDTPLVCFPGGQSELVFRLPIA